MKNLFLQAVAGDSQKSEAGGNLTIEITGLKLTRTVSHRPMIRESGTPKVGDESHGETVEVEAENIKMSGEMKGTVAGLFNFIVEMNDQLKSVRKEVKSGEECPKEISLDIEQRN